MPKTYVCRICLRSDGQVRDVADNINDFYDEICEYDTYDNNSLKYCLVCEYQLWKFYNFKQRCLRANTVLKAWRKDKVASGLKSLHKFLPSSSLGFCSLTAKHKISDFKYTDHGPSIDHTNVDSVTLGSNKADWHFNLNQVVTATEFEKINIPEDTDYTNNDSDFVTDFKEENDDGLIDSGSESDECLASYIKSKWKTKKENSEEKQLQSLVVELQNSESKKEKSKCIKTKLDDDLPQNDKKYLSIKQKVVEILERNEIQELGDNSKMTKDVFLKIYDKFLLSDMRMLSLKKDSQGQYNKLKKALLHLLKKYNPDYETVFDIEYLDSEKKKLDEFNRRKDSKAYIDAAFKCELCLRGFEKITQFDYHNKWHKPEAGDFSCGICGMRFQSLKTRASHRASSHSAVYCCKMCPLITYHYSVMLNHYEQHKGVEYTCPTCLSVFENKTTFMNHQRDHNADKRKSTCTACAATFISDVGLMLHRKSKHVDEVASNPGAHSTCHECNITFDSGEVYQKHIAMAHTKKVESCAYCHIRFTSLEELRAHKIEMGHQRASKKYARTTQRSNEPNPVTKIKINTPDQPFVKCELCPAMVSTAFTSCMYKHFLKDHPDIPYSSVYSQTARRLLCDLCGKTFMDPAFFADHANMHSGAKPYLCAQCPSRFATRRHLGLHAQRHGPARHVCNHCGKRFHSAANLFNHRKTHIGDRRFKCEICFKGFLHAATLNEHVRGVHHHIRKQKPHRDRKNSY